MNEAVVRLIERPVVYLAWLRRFVSSKVAPAWHALLTEHFDEAAFEPSAVPAWGPMLWSMVYFEGSPKRHG